jgi:hypothetical protein
MRFQIEPVPISIVRTCKWINFEFIEILDTRIIIEVEFLDVEKNSIYKGKLQLNDIDLELWNVNELDLIQWIMNRFELNYTFEQDLPQLKRKDLFELESEINKKRKV